MNSNLLVHTQQRILAQNRTIRFDFTPKLAIVYETASSYTGHSVFVVGCPKSFSEQYNKTLTVEWDGNSISWYGSSAAVQLNSNATYYYVALG